MNTLIGFTATYLHLLSVVVFLYYGVTSQYSKRFVQSALLTGILALGLGLTAATLYNNPRPFMLPGAPAALIANPPTYNGFPSGHALFTGTLAAIVSVFDPYVGAALWLIAFAVGIARVLAGVHHPVDIIASYAIAACSALVVWKARQHYAKPGK
jgi:membrane-associated phospholipid phosphatase